MTRQELYELIGYVLIAAASLAAWAAFLWFIVSVVQLAAAS